MNTRILTAQDLQLNIEQLSAYTDEQLAGMTTLYIRQLLSSIKVTNVQRGNTVVPTSRARKTELIAAIKTMTASNQVLATVGLTELSPEDVRVGLASLDYGAGIEYADYAKSIYDQLRDYTLGQWDNETQRWKLPTQVPTQLGLSLYLWLSNRRTQDDSPLSGSSRVTYASKIRKTVIDLINQNDKGTSYYDELLAAYKQLRSQTLNLLSQDNKDKLVNQKVAATYRQGHSQPVNPEALLTYARSVLASVTVGDKPNWHDVSIALVLLTGRRPSEIHATAEFTLKDENTLTFTGQLKKKEHHDSSSYDIPTLAPASHCIKGLEYIVNKGKYYKGEQARAAKNISSEISKYAIQRWYDRYLPNVQNYKDEQGRLFRVRTHYRMRELYALIALRSYESTVSRHLSASDKVRYISSILGHEEASKAYESYDANFYLVE